MLSRAELDRLPPRQRSMVERAQNMLRYARGDLRFVLHPGPQREIYDFFHRTKGTLFVPVLACRGFGKSTVSLVFAIEHCIRYPRQRVYIVCDTTKHAHEIVQENVDWITDNGPAELRPTLHVHQSRLTFPNGSFLQCVGTDNGRSNRLRGKGAHLIVIEEGRDIRDFAYVMKDIAIPMVRREGFNGRMIAPTTAPRSQAHGIVPHLQSAKVSGMPVFTIDQLEWGPYGGDEGREQAEKDYGGRESMAFRREWLCELIVDENIAVLPEFESMKGEIVTEWVRPSHFYIYTIIDYGKRDAVFAAFGYVDFEEAKHVIEDEIMLHNPSIPAIIEAVEEKERELWGARAERTDEWGPRRYADVTYGEAIKEFKRRGFRYKHPKKGQTRDGKLADKRATANVLRTRLNRFRIHPRCKNLVLHMESAVWKEGGDHGTDAFERVYGIDGKIHHYDGVDCAIYFDLNASLSRNPFPHPEAANPQKSHPGRSTSDEKQRRLAEAFSRRARRAR